MLKKQKWELEIACRFSITDSNRNLAADKREERGFTTDFKFQTTTLYLSGNLGMSLWIH